MARVRSRRAKLAPGTQLDPMQVADLRGPARGHFPTDVPVRLRRLPDHPDPRPVFMPEPDLPTVAAYQRAKAARQSVEDGRIAFLATHALMEPSELEAIRKPAKKRA